MMNDELIAISNVRFEISNFKSVFIHHSAFIIHH